MELRHDRFVGCVAPVLVCTSVVASTGGLGYISRLLEVGGVYLSPHVGSQRINVPFGKITGSHVRA